MKRSLLLPFAASLLLVLAGSSFAQHGHDHATPAAPASPLEALKKLAGDWDATAQHGEQKFPTTVRWSVTAGGSAVTELLFVGTPHEMLTVYTVQDGRLVLTHYCAGGNQPFMKQRPGGKEGELVFDFAGGANLDPARDSHMHSGRVTLVDADHVHSEWQSWDKGRPTDKAVFEMTRRR